MTETMTLDPPGRIAVIGAGPIGIEAALYGRYLGYDVVLLESGEIAQALKESRGQPLPCLPDRCLSRLAIGAIEAQAADTSPKKLPTTVDEWIDDALVPVTESDLLRGRVKTNHKVVRIDHVSVEQDDSDESIPPDFSIVIEGERDSIDAESIIITCADNDELKTSFPLPTEYFFRIESKANEMETKLNEGRQGIVSIFAMLGGREDLDLYRPIRG